MAKPRVFVSSTYYDLKHIRDRLEAFIDSLGYEAVLFESGDVPFRHDSPLDESCYAEVHLCHILVLVIGGRYGNPASSEKQPAVADRFEFYNSITKKEYLAARERDIPVYIFVDRNVLAEYETYRRNKDRSDVAYAHVDSVNIFRLLDEILSRDRNNLVRGFERFDDIGLWLRDQWAGLFADLISRRSSDAGLKDISVRVAELGQITGALKQYSEVILKKLQPEQSEELISEQERRLMAGRVGAFATEPMLKYIMNDFVPEMTRRHPSVPVPPITPGRLYTAFERSSSLEGFLLELGFAPIHITQFLEMHSAYAPRDYQQIAQRYFDRIVQTGVEQNASTPAKPPVVSEVGEVAIAVLPQAAAVQPAVAADNPAAGTSV